MRAFITTCLTLTLIVQVGCATTAIKTSHVKQELDSRVAKRYLAARQLESRGKLEPAREIYSSLLLQHPRNPDIQHRLAVVCTRLQRYGEAQSLYTKALKRDPRNPSLLADMGYFYYTRGDSVEAEMILKQALHLRPDDVRATSNLALVVGRQGRVEESLKLLRAVHDEPGALSNLAYIHHLRGEETLAKQCYREALELDPNLGDAGMALAELTKLYPDITIADFIPPEAVTEPAALPEATKIQQVSAVAESTKRTVTAASFTTEAIEEDEPAETQHKSNGLRRMTAHEATAELDEPAATAPETTWSEPETALEADDGLDWSAYDSDAAAEATSEKPATSTRDATEWDAN